MLLYILKYSIKKTQNLGIKKYLSINLLFHLAVKYPQSI